MNPTSLSRWEGFLLVLVMLAAVVVPGIPTQSAAAASSAQQSVVFYLPYDSSLENIKATRTGRIYEADYKAAGLTYMNSGDYHDGAMRGAIDFTLSYQPVYAAAAGKVVEVGKCHIYVDHGNGIKSFYQHLSAKKVGQNDRVDRTTVIGTAGECDSPGQPHLHFAVFSGNSEIKVFFGDASAQATGGLIRPSHMDGNPTYFYKADPKTVNYTPPTGYAFCAYEGERCNFAGWKELAYGASGAFVYRSAVKSSFVCSNSAGGGDPLVGTKKACFIKNTPVTPPAGFTFCANENQRCNFSGVKDVVYGAYDKFVAKNAQVNSIVCNNSAFGDPYTGVGKICAYRDSPNNPPAGYVFCAKEGGYCSVTGPKQVAYGAYGKFLYKTVYSGFSCANGAFGGDPLVGVGKTCYYKK